MEIWKTAAKYHLIHAVAVCAVSMAGNRLNRPGWLLTAGIIIFSGSLYVLAITQVKVLGAITPLGGVCFIGGWIWICALATKGNASA